MGCPLGALFRDRAPVESQRADDGAAARKRSVADPDTANGWPIWAVDDNALPTTAVAVIRVATVVIAGAHQTETQPQSDARVSPTPASPTSEAGASETTPNKAASTAPDKTASTTPNKTSPASPEKSTAPPSPDKSTAPASTTSCKRASGSERDTDDGRNDQQEFPIHRFLHDQAGDWGLAIRADTPPVADD